MTKASNFKNIGISSPVLEAAFNFSDIMWFDLLSTTHKNSFSSSYDSACEWNVMNDNASLFIYFILSGKASKANSTSKTILSQLYPLWENIFNHPDTKIHIEYCEERPNIKEGLNLPQEGVTYEI